MSERGLPQPSRGRALSRSRSPERRGRDDIRGRSRSPPRRGRNDSRSRSRSPPRRGRFDSRSRSPPRRRRDSSSRSRSPPRRGRNDSRSRSRSPPRRGRFDSRSRSPPRRRRDSSSRSRSPPRRGRNDSRSRSRSPPCKDRDDRRGGGGQHEFSKTNSTKPPVPTEPHPPPPPPPPRPPRQDFGFPDVNSIYKGRVVKIESFGAFVEIPPFRSHGLVHLSQIAKHRVEKVDDVLELNQAVFVKVLSVEMTDNPNGPPRAKISLSIKYVDQAEGMDRDPESIEAEGEARKRRPRDAQNTETGSGAGTSDAALNTTCAKCGGRGHLASECYNKKGQQYDFLEEDRGAVAMGRGRDVNLPSWLADDVGAGLGGAIETKSQKKADKHKKKAKKAEKKAAKAERKDMKKALKKEKKGRKRRDSSSDSKSNGDSADDSDSETGPKPTLSAAPKAASVAFIASLGFQGKREGYVFKNGGNGVGYYVDKST